MPLKAEKLPFVEKIYFAKRVRTGKAGKAPQRGTNVFASGSVHI